MFLLYNNFVPRRAGEALRPRLHVRFSDDASRGAGVSAALSPSPPMPRTLGSLFGLAPPPAWYTYSCRAARPCETPRLHGGLALLRRAAI
jgi:hypothetical protein